ncbi:MAG: acetate--CoA ligase family protein [Rhodobacteraceae bacterium]|nr:acetate--CoA ligase family protein [Paracoccaceae bacterium]
MNFEEWVSKPLLREFGIATPEGAAFDNPQAARAAFQGPCTVKAQVPAGARGKAGGIKFAFSPEEAFEAAAGILGSTISGHHVERVLVEEKVEIEQELYAAVLTDRTNRCPSILFSAAGGVDVENMAASRESAMHSLQVDILNGFSLEQAEKLVADTGIGTAEGLVAETLTRLYAAYRSLDAELLEINPLAVTKDGRVVALDCKFTLDDASVARQPGLAGKGAPESRTDLERAAAKEGLRLIQLDGSVGILANGAGLTMTTMDAVAHFGGSPANFLEIGGDAYTKAEPALRIVLSQPGVKSLLVNFCGAFARTDVMAAGVVKAWKRLNPAIPAFFSVHGTGEEKAVALIRDELGIEPFDRMDDAVKAAVAAAGSKP